MAGAKQAALQVLLLALLLSCPSELQAMLQLV
jgi:hypothetical protein